MSRSKGNKKNSEKLFSSSRINKTVALWNLARIGAPKVGDARRLQAANDAVLNRDASWMTDENSHVCMGCGERFFADDIDHDYEECIEGGMLAFLCHLDEVDLDRGDSVEEREKAS